jgi:hypothetical protein
MNALNSLAGKAIKSMDELDKTGWTKYGPTKCECIEAKTGHSKTAGGLKDTIIRTLVDIESAEELVFFFNAIKNKSGNFAVSHQGKFAKLYRLTTGENPLPRFSKAQQLMKHFIGEYFICEYKTAKAINGHCYNKVTSIKPEKSHQNKAWLPTGFHRKTKRIEGGKKPDPRKLAGNSLEKDWQSPGNQLETEIGANLCPIYPEPSIESHNNITTSRVSTYQHASPTRDIRVIHEQEHVFTYHRMPNETDDHYFDRVIYESWNWREA